MEKKWVRVFDVSAYLIYPKITLYLALLEFKFNNSGRRLQRPLTVSFENLTHHQIYEYVT